MPDEGKAAEPDLIAKDISSTEEVAKEIDAFVDFYQSPVDGVNNRLDLQHQALKVAIDSIIFKPKLVQRAMSASTISSKPAAIDLGSGTGTWAVEFANLYPGASIIGFDQVTPPLRMDAPANCRFEQGDINLGLAQYKDSANVVHVRCVVNGVVDLQMFFHDIGEILRPGGVLLTVDPDLAFYDENLEVIKESDKSFTWTNRVMMALGKAMTKRESSDMKFHSIPTWLNEMDVWEETGSEGMYVPLGPWKDTMSENEIKASTLMRLNIIQVAEFARPVLIASGIPAETVNEWREKMRDELMNLRTKQYIKWHCAWAIKKGPV